MRFRKERIIPVILVTIIIVIIVAVVVSLSRVIFSGISERSANEDTSRQTLLDVSAGNSVQMNVRGPIVANETFRSFRIDVTPQSRTITTYSGYDEQNVIDTRKLKNTPAAYADFVNALDRLGLATGTQFDESRDNRLGVCATGQLYEFAIIKDGEPVKELWTTTCRNATGSLRASTKQLRELFIKQVPDAASMVRKIKQ